MHRLPGRRVFILAVPLALLAGAAQAAIVGPPLDFPSGESWAVAAGPHGWLVLTKSGSCVSVARDGTISATAQLPGGPLPLPWSWEETNRADIVFDGTAFVAAWADGDAARVARLDESCEILAPGIRTLPMVAACDELASTWCWPTMVQADVPATALSFDGSELTVGWTRLVSLDAEVVNVVYAARLSTSLELLDAEPVRIAERRTGPYHPLDVTSVDVASTPTRTAIAFSIIQYTYRETAALLFDRSWNVLSEAYSGTSAPQQTMRIEPALATDGATFLIAQTAPLTDPGCTGVFGSYVASRTVGVFPGTAMADLPGSAGQCLDLYSPTRVVHDGLRFFAWWAEGYQYVDGSGVFLGPSRPGLPYAPDAVIAFGPDGTGLFVHGGGARLVTTWMRVSVGTSGYGSGSVESSPPGISCGAACQARFDADGPVVLSAQPDATSRFLGWTGACEGAGAQCVVTGDVARSVTAASAVFADTVPPVVTVPADARVTATTRDGAVFSYQASARDNVHGAIEPRCSPASGSVFPPGVTTVTCAAADADGNLGTASFQVAVTFAWSGVLAPLHSHGETEFELGRIVPVRFSLVGASRPISDLQARLFLSKVSRGEPGGEDGAAPASAAGGDRVFRYDAASRQYILRLATRALTAGKWRLRIDLGDGVEHSVLVSLTPSRHQDRIPR